MRLDSPDYATIYRKSPFYGTLWKIGNGFSIVGIVAALLTPLILGANFAYNLWSGIEDRPFYSLLVILIVTLVFLVIAFIGKQMQSIAVRMTDSE